MNFDVSSQRCYSVDCIRNVGFVGKLYSMDEVYDAVADYDPEYSDRDSFWDSPGGTHYDFEAIAPICSVGIARNGKKCKYNIFSQRAIQEYMFAYIADGFVCSAPVWEDGNLFPLNWKYYLELKEQHNTPGIIVLLRSNEKSHESFCKTVENLQKQYQLNAVSVVIPLDDTKIAALVEQKCYEFDSNGKIVEIPLPEEFSETVEKAYISLISSAIDGDEKLMADFIENKLPDAEQLKKSLRKKVLSGDVVPVLYSKPFHRRHSQPSVIYGTELLLDAISDYLPSPCENDTVRKIIPEDSNIRYCCDDSPFSAVVLALRSGMACLRVLSGTLNAGMSVMNCRTGSFISLPFKKSIFSGDSIIVSSQGSCRMTRSASEIRDTQLEIPAGDFQQFKLADVISSSTQKIALQLPEFLPEPVMAVTLSFANKKDHDECVREFEKLQPSMQSLHIIENLSAGTITGAIDYKNLDLFVSCLSFAKKQKVQPEVFCRETLLQKAVSDYEYSTSAGNTGEYARCVLEVEPAESGSGVSVINCTGDRSIPKEFINAVKAGVAEAVWSVEIPDCYPLYGITVNIIECTVKPGVSTAEAFKKAGFFGLKAAVKKAGTRRLTPAAVIKFRVKEELYTELIEEIVKFKSTIADITIQGSSADITVEFPLAEIDRLVDNLRNIPYSMEVTGTFFE